MLLSPLLLYFCKISKYSSACFPDRRTRILDYNYWSHLNTEYLSVWYLIACVIEYQTHGSGLWLICAFCLVNQLWLESTPKCQVPWGLERSYIKTEPSSLMEWGMRNRKRSWDLFNAPLPDTIQIFDWSGFGTLTVSLLLYFTFCFCLIWHLIPITTVV